MSRRPAVCYPAWIDYPAGSKADDSLATDWPDTCHISI